MAEKTPVDVLNSHHSKINDHTAQLAALQARIIDLDQRVTGIETEHKPMRDFIKRIHDWVGALKD